MQEQTQIARMKSSEAVAGFVNILLIVLCVAMETASLDMFLQEPEDSVSFSGDHVTLKCQVNQEAFAQNAHDMIVAWKKDNALFINSSSSSVAAAPSSKGAVITGNSSIGEYHLTFASASEGNSGNYTCGIYMFVMVQISGGEVHNVTVLVGATDPASLTVLPDVQPVCSFEPDLEDDDTPTILTGTLMSFICSIPDFNSFQLHWQIKSRTATNINDRIVEGATSNESMNATILVYNTVVTPLDNGNVLECKMRSLVFPTMTRICALPPLKILYKPNVNIVPLSNISNIYVGDDISFFCSVNANPLEDEIEWIVTPPQNIAFHGHQIEVHQAFSPESFINLTCQASNDIGMTSTFIVVHLRPVYKPLIYISLVTSSLKTRQEDGARFRCNIDASPPEVTIRWVAEPHQHVSMQEHGPEMTLYSLIPKSMYVDISCLVTNRVGGAMAHAFIYLPPAAPSEQSTINPFGSTLSFANTSETGSTPQYLVHPTNQPVPSGGPVTKTTSETPIPESTSESSSSNVTVLEPNVAGTLPFSPFEESFHTPFIPQVTIDSTPTEQTRTLSVMEWYPATTDDTPGRSQGNAFKLNKYIIGGGAAGGILLLITLVAMALCFSRMKINKALGCRGCTRVIYHPDDNSLTLPFAQSRQSDNNPYQFLNAALHACQQEGTSTGLTGGMLPHATTKF